MIVVTDVQLASMRVTDEARMVDTCSIVSKVRVSDGAGGHTYTETSQDDVPCYRAPNLAGNVEMQFGGQLYSGLQWKFVFPYGTTISNDDEIAYGAERFAVMGSLGPRTLETAVRVIAVEIS